jgi:uncharacterized protein (TIGR02588 family)
MSKMEPLDASNELERDDGRSHPTLAERVTFGLASLILAVFVGLVIYVWLDQERQKPPIISVEESQSIREVTGQFYVPFDVTNTGGNTAESVQIIAELKINGEVAESGEQQIDFLSGGETATGAFVFSQDPRLGDLMVRVASYKLP